MASPTASGAEITVWGISRAQLIPTTAASMLPPMSTRGWASGLAGRAKASTAEAPTGATSKGVADKWPSIISRAARPQNPTPSRAPAAARKASRTGIGARPRISRLRR